MISTTNTINNNNILNFGGDGCGSAFENFGVYQQKPVKLGELSLSTHVINCETLLLSDPFSNKFPLRFILWSLSYSCGIFWYYYGIRGIRNRSSSSVYLSFFFIFCVSTLIVLPFLIHPERLLRYWILITARGHHLFYFSLHFRIAFFLCFSFLYSVHYILTFFPSNHIQYSTAKLY